jgi:hypothetical protein
MGAGAAGLMRGRWFPSPMASPSSPFCAHKRLRTACPECKPAAAVPPAPPELRPYSEPKKQPAPRGPRRQKAPSRSEAEQAEAWWVKK